MKSPNKIRNLIIFTIAITIFIAVPLAVLNLSATAAHFMITNPIAERAMPFRTPADYNLDFESIELVTQDGLRLAAWYIPSKNGAALMAIHGYKSNRVDMLEETEMLVRHGYGVLLFDNRAHGESDGETIRFGAQEMLDFDAAFQFLLSRQDVDPDRIGIIAISNGAAMSILYAAQNPGIAALVTDSAYASLQEEIAIGVDVYTILPAPLFAPFVQYFAEREANIKARDISPVAVIADISPRPILIMQGGQDGNIPLDSGQQLYDAAKQPKQFWFVADSQHTMISSDYPQEYERRIIAFFDLYLLGITN